jgi:hypothetical protein
MDPITLLLLLGGGGSIVYSFLKKKPGQQGPNPVDSVLISDPSAIPVSSLLAAHNAGPNITKAISDKVTGTASGLGGSALGVGVGGGLAGAGLGAAAGAWVAGGGFLGKMITGDIYGGVAGALSTTAGNAGNLGRVLGRELDKFFGGDGKTGTGIVLQGVGFVGGLAVGVFGLMALPLFGQVIALVAAIGAAFSDNARLAYGQAGIIQDTKEAAEKFYATTLPELRAKVLKAYNIQQLTPEDEFRTKCFALAYTRGFIGEENQAKYRIHMAKTKGVFVSDHRQWAVDRGVFVENMAPVLDGLYFLISPLPMPSVPPSGRGLPPMQFVRWLSTPDGKALGVAISGVAQAGKNLYMGMVGAYNSDIAVCVDRGRFLSNLMHYIQSMAEPWGIGTGAKAHAEFWKDQYKAFTGRIDGESGNLIDGGFYVDWKASLDNGAPVMQALK